MYDSRAFKNESSLRDCRESRLAEQKNEYDSKKASILEAREKKYKTEKEYVQFKEGAKIFFLTEAINHILRNSYNESKSIDEIEKGRFIVESFVIEEGVDKLLLAFETKTSLLSEISLIVNNSYSTVLESVDVHDPSTFRIKPSDEKDFYNTLKNLDIDQVTNKIKERVADATQEFIQNNINDKLDMEDLAQGIKDKVDSVKSKSKDTEEQIKQEFANMYKSKLNDIRAHRNKNIYEQLVNKTTSGVVKDEGLREAFTNESGKLQTSSIISSVDTMYTFLEVVNSVKLRKVDQAYLESVIESIK